MRKAQKEAAENFVKLLEKANDEIRKQIEKKNYEPVPAALADCQDGAIALGNMIEESEGEGFATISMLEEYCELLYRVHQSIVNREEISAGKVYKSLCKLLTQIENSIRHDIPVRREAVFLPYKASMWDSMESVWMAAEADPECDAYVIPIPYYDKNPDGSFGQMHYEAELMPEYVTITKFDEYNFEERRPDMVYIHNPYDEYNYVTSVHPFFYSKNLKQYTDLLVYIPYYVTAGGMSEGQALCPAYLYADYIVLQAEKYKKFFDPGIPENKFLVLGSPKLDKVIRLCNNPPEPPQEWKEQLEGKTVYFYNTSLGGMLGNTEGFLKKMEYVFSCFEGREDACLLWRPHPLLETTFDSMRSQYKPIYEALKQRFIEKNLGIYDTTPGIEETIALSDVYIGDAGSSVTSLFGAAGKPVFILDNNINTLPQKDDWRGAFVTPIIDAYGNIPYQVKRDNTLWYSEKNDGRYSFYMDLDKEHSGGNYYCGAVEINGMIYVMPQNAQHLLMVKDKRVIKKIEFKEPIVQQGAFCGYTYTEKYIFLFPFLYHSLLRYELETGRLTYITGVREFNVQNINGEWKLGGRLLSGSQLYFASPSGSRILTLDIDTLGSKELNCPSKSNLGIQAMIPHGEEFWLLPINGLTVTRWNPSTGDVREYDRLPEGFCCRKWPLECTVQEHPFSMAAFVRQGESEQVILSPFLGNMFVSLTPETGETEEWEPPMELTYRGKNGYFPAGSVGNFCFRLDQGDSENYPFWHMPERRLYEINISTKEYHELPIVYDYDEVAEQENGFMEESDWMQYCCNESAMNSLNDLLDGTIKGNPFSRERAIRAFEKINASPQGDCGERLYRLMKEKS